MYTIEKYHIYKTTREGKQINDKNTVGENKIFEIFYTTIPHRWLHITYTPTPQLNFTPPERTTTNT
jgi:heme/copper-type cytochrome/quinol oxidase subunit 2